ncbi:microtubule-associated proteins 1A/1B light chain 3C-like isoform X1 [Penaeus indicus]|uniref:microtubule-associated proteins 1A/1B light chain 3C-like isoform X1 n=1 Tax=Penaeus indicus TaxID=29960 RepID=UPI00300C62FB
MCNCVFCSKSFTSSCVYRNMNAYNADNNDNTKRTFKQLKPFLTRKEEVANIRAKFPTKIPVIVERYAKESTLPVLDKTKFLVPQELTMSQFVTIIRWVFLCFGYGGGTFL